MVSLDSTSRVIVLPVTEREVSKRFRLQAEVANSGVSLTGLDEDLHDCGVMKD